MLTMGCVLYSGCLSVPQDADPLVSGSLLLCCGLCHCPPSRRGLDVPCLWSLCPQEWAVSLHPSPFEILFLNSLQVLLPECWSLSVASGAWP